jgi:molybdenum cofactor cytidylyltransferase
LATGGPSTQAFEAIVLAAGAGLRFGGGKLLAPYGNGVLLDGALAAAFAAPVRFVTVVIGADAPRVAAAARAFALKARETHRLRMVHAQDHEEGMGASLRAGADSLPNDAGGVFVFLGDMPRVPHEILEELALAARRAPAAAPTFQGRRGHPVVLHRSLFPQLRRLSGDQGARTILAGLYDGVALIEAPDDGVLFDVDTKRDLKP